MTGIKAAVRYAKQHDHDVKLPASAVKLLQSACAKIVALRDVASSPPKIKNLTSQISAIEAKIQRLNRDKGRGSLESDSAIKKLEDEKKALQTNLADLNARWSIEKKLVEEIQQQQTIIDTEETSHIKDAAITKQKKLKQELNRQDGPLVPIEVNESLIASVVSEKFHIPVGQIRAGDAQKLSQLKEKLKEDIKGQDAAIDFIARQVTIGRVLKSDTSPVAKLILAGPTRTGKTETAKLLAKSLFNSKPITVDMTTYSSPFSISRLTGAEPGLIGYHDRTVLDDVRERPFSLILLDEFDKAHADVQKFFYRILDEGKATNAHGKEVDFTNTIIVMTTNLGDQTIEKAGQGASFKTLSTAIKKDLTKEFGPALVARMRVVPFIPIAGDAVRQIVNKELSQLVTVIKNKFPQVDHIDFDDSVLNVLVERFNENSEDGASEIKNQVDDISGKICDQLTNLEKNVSEECIFQVEYNELEQDFIVNLSVNF